MHRTLATAISATALVTACLAGIPAAAASTSMTWPVAPGTGTISAAVAKAKAGDTIQLEAGTYYDSVFVTKPLTISGVGNGKTTLRPSPHPDNFCDQANGASEGICAVGALDSQGNPITSHRLKGVHIQRLRVTGFQDAGVLGFNTDGLRVNGVWSDHNGGYGIARFASINSVFEYNWTQFNGEAGLYMGDSPYANSVIRYNRSDNNTFGIFMRDSTYLQASNNVVAGNCVGIMALWTGGEAPGDLQAGHYTINDNVAAINDAACPGGDAPPLSGIGIALAGTAHTNVWGNTVRNNKPTGQSIASGGIVLISTAFAGGSDPSDNHVHGNDVRFNQPADIVWDGTGTGNQVNNNTCNKAIPNNLGWC
jgi:hypothetical protein